MSIPVRSCGILVGRTEEIKDAVNGLLENGAQGRRVVIHGVPGSGKDTVAVEVVRNQQVKNSTHFQLQAWFQGSTDEQLRRQLRDFFSTHYPEILGTGTTLDQDLTEIRRWLEHNDGWLFVIEDAAKDCKALKECIPPGGNGGKGVVLITSLIDWSGDSQVGVTLSIPLEPISPQLCRDLWKKIGIWSKKANIFDKVSTTKEPGSETHLQEMCDKCQPKVSYVVAAAGETQEQKAERWNKMLSQILGNSCKT